jgi:hypothetical protein
MSEQNGSTTLTKDGTEPVVEGKGKGKAAPGAEDTTMDTGAEESSSEEEAEVRCTIDVLVCLHTR